MGLKDKASKIQFAGLGQVATAGNGERSAKTAPGELMAFANQQRSSLLAENEELKEKAAKADALQHELTDAQEELRQWDGAKATRLLDPASVIHSKWANRLKPNFDNEEFQQLREEIRSAGGNVQPIKVRPVGDGRFEIVFGHRRHEACRLEGVPVLALIDNLDDQTLFVEMDRENRARKNLSPYEQGLMYRNALNANLFSNQKELAETTGADASLITKALYLADLPEEVIGSFPSVLEIQFRFAKPLNDAIRKDRAAVIAAASSLISDGVKRDAKEVFDALIKAASGVSDVQADYPAPLSFEREGQSIGSMSVGAKGLSLSIKKGYFSEKEAERLRAFVEKLLGVSDGK